MVLENVGKTNEIQRDMACQELLLISFWTLFASKIYEIYVMNLLFKSLKLKGRQKKLFSENKHSNLDIQQM